MSFGVSEWLVIFLIAGIFFGAKVLPRLSYIFGKSAREFKKAFSEETETTKQQVHLKPLKQLSSPNSSKNECTT